MTKAKSIIFSDDDKELKIEYEHGIGVTVSIDDNTFFITEDESNDFFDGVDEIETLRTDGE